MRPRSRCVGCEYTPRPPESPEMLPIYLLLVYYWLYRRFVRPAYRRWREIRLRTMRRRVVLLWQYPSAGRVRKDLIPQMGAIGAAHVQLLAYDHSLNVLSKLQTHPPPTATCTEVCWRGAEEEAVQYWLERRQPPVLRRPQFSGDLGLKLATAAAGAFREGVEYVLVVMRVAPAITESVILEAFNSLARGSDMVLGPTLSGGYYCIGFTKRAEPHLPYMFLGLEWESEKLLHQQCLIADRIGLKYTILPEKLATIDSPDGLLEFEGVTGTTRDDIFNPQWTAVIPVPTHCTPEQIETSVMQLVQKGDSSDKVCVVIVDKNSSKSITKCVRDLEQRVKTFGAKLEVIQEAPSSPSSGNVIIVGLDTAVPLHWDTIAKNCLAQPGVVAGAFRFGSDIIHDSKKRRKATFLHRAQANTLEWTTNLISRSFEKPTFEQALFLHCSTAKHIEEFLSADSNLSHIKMLHSISRLGHIATTDGDPCCTSYHHFNFKVLLQTAFLHICYRLGFYRHSDWI